MPHLSGHYIRGAARVSLLVGSFLQVSLCCDTAVYITNWWIGSRLVHDSSKELVYDKRCSRAHSLQEDTPCHPHPSLFAFPTHHWKLHRFNLNAKHQRERYLCLSFTVLLPQQSHSSGRRCCKGTSPPRAHCSTDHTDHSIASDWLPDTLGLYLIRMNHPFCSCVSFQVLCLIFSPAGIPFLPCG